VRDRVYRLGLPVLFYMLVLGPFTEYFCAHSWNSTAPTSFANERLSFLSGVRWLVIVLPAGSVAWLTILRAGGAFAGNGAAYSGGWHWQAASMNLWESFTCVAMCYGLLVIFCEILDRQGSLAKFLSDQLGHASISFTLERYSHLLPSIQDEAAARVERLLMGFIFPSPRVPDQPIRNVRKAWAKTLKDAKIAYFPIYNRRHAFCTRLSEMASDTVVTKAMRHSSAETKRRYQLGMVEKVREAMNLANTETYGELENHIFSTVTSPIVHNGKEEAAEVIET